MLTGSFRLEVLSLPPCHQPICCYIFVIFYSGWLRIRGRVAHRRCTVKTLVTRRQALAAASALTLAPFTANAGEQEKVGMQLILAADVSGSVNVTRYRTQQDGYLEALGDSRVLNVIG